MEFFSHHVLAYMWCGTSLGFWVCASSSWFFRLLFFFIFLQATKFLETSLERTRFYAKRSYLTFSHRGFKNQSPNPSGHWEVTVHWWSIFWFPSIYSGTDRFFPFTFQLSINMYFQKYFYVFNEWKAYPMIWFYYFFCSLIFNINLISKNC